MFLIVGYKRKSTYAKLHDPEPALPQHQSRLVLWKCWYLPFLTLPRLLTLPDTILGTRGTFPYPS